MQVSGIIFLISLLIFYFLLKLDVNTGFRLFGTIFCGVPAVATIGIIGAVGLASVVGIFGGAYFFFKGLYHFVSGKAKDGKVL